jgi:UDP-N-acetylmuramyl pentapeptide phosphotransferase/UDP-N-acetylglucosamine-1-phosphate transferase
MEKLLMKSVPYLTAFLGSLSLTLFLVPLVRRLNIRLGMIDKPDQRRINKIPIPRGGGLALIAGVLVSYSIFVLFFGKDPFYAKNVSENVYWKYAVLSLSVGALGFVDDCFGMKPKVKLLGQIAVAVLTWWWCDLGFHRLWPSIPAAIDCFMTVFWIVGAVNAFNLIDGLDGLASGLAFIATLGMAGALFLCHSPASSLYYFAFAGGLLGFLRYNYNPASIFLGDCGSMFIGYTIAFLPLASQAENSFLVSIGVPLLAMGVPVFDTFLAIVRRSLRRLIRRRDSSEAGNGEVMTADADHVHHRILRSVGLNQRKAAWILYIVALLLVLFGLSGVIFKSRAAGLWLLGFLFSAVVVVKDMARIEIFDFGRLINSVARNDSAASRRLKSRLSVPFYLLADIALLVAVFFVCAWALKITVGRIMLRVGMPIRVVSVFIPLVLFKTYLTVWSRAMPSDYARLLFACVVGGVVGSAAIYYSPAYNYQLKAMTVMYPLLSFVALSLLRNLRMIVRDTFYDLDCSRLLKSGSATRVLVYGSGLRYRAFRRELVRTASENDRIIVGIVDDNILLRGQYIGDVKVCGSIGMIDSIIKETRADAVVIACELSPQRLAIVRQRLAAAGLPVSMFYLNEKKLDFSAEELKEKK